MHWKDKLFDLGEVAILQGEVAIRQGEVAILQDAGVRSVLHQADISHRIQKLHKDLKVTALSGKGGEQIHTQEQVVVLRHLPPVPRHLLPQNQAQLISACS